MWDIAWFKERSKSHSRLKVLRVTYAVSFRNRRLVSTIVFPLQTFLRYRNA